MSLLRAVPGILTLEELDETVTAIALTHNHSDHSPLAGPLKAATGAAIHGCAVRRHVDESLAADFPHRLVQRFQVSRYFCNIHTYIL